MDQYVHRIRFSKTGKMIYISHLDLTRLFGRAFARAGLPLYYSEGFNPHPRYSFALPMSVGTGSLCEFLDLKLSEDIDPQVTKEALSCQMPADIEILDAYRPEQKFKEITDADYELVIESEAVTRDTPGAVLRLIAGGDIVITKKGKAGEHDVNVAPQIRSCDAAAEPGKLTLKLRLCADTANFLNPGHLLRYFDAAFGWNLKEDIDSSVSILRTAVYAGDRPFV